MADFEKVEYEFPDEKEENPKASQEADNEPVDAANPEIEIVDDTPEADRGRAPSEPPKEVTEDELQKYSDQKLKDRLAHLGKGYHDERRAKEAALREREEAIRLAQTLIEENKKLKGSLNQGQSALIEQAKKAVELELEQAKKKFKDAYEAGDSDALLLAQEELTAAKIKADRVNNFKPKALQEEEKEVKIPEPVVESPKGDPKALAWQEQNQWFGQDDEMTSFALGLHQKLVKSGVDPRSDEYYERIDKRMRQVFPDQFGEVETPVADSAPRQKKANVVAPVSRSVAPKKVTLTTTQVALAKKLGVPLELYAKQVAEEMRKQNG